MAGNVYATSGLPKEPVYTFQIVASHNDFTIFRDFEMDGKCDDTLESILVHFKSLHIAAKETQGRVLSRVEDVFLAVQNNRRLIANVMLEFGEHVVDLHFPVKHINIQINSGRFQVETGPVAVPLALFFKHKVNETEHDKVGRAYVFINDYHKAEFLLQSVIVTDGRLSRKYSQAVAYPAATTLIEIE